MGRMGLQQLNLLLVPVIITMIMNLWLIEFSVFQQPILQFDHFIAFMASKLSTLRCLSQHFPRMVDGA